MGPIGAIILLVVVIVGACVLWEFIKNKILRSANSECKVCGDIISSHRLDQLCDRCRNNGHT